MATESHLPFIESVLHPTDFSEGGEVAFAHALAIALVRQASLTLLHGGDRVVENWERFPRVRKTLERWGLLASGSEREAVFRELAVGVTKLDVKGDPVKATLDYVSREEPDIVVVGTAGRDGLERWMRPSKAQQIARRVGAMTLFVPNAGRPMVSLDDGSVRLSRILIPIAETPDPGRALVLATRAAAALGDAPVRITRLHVGAAPPPLPAPATDPAWAWEEVQRTGDVIEEIVAAARDADLVVMPTDGRDAPIDVFRGSHTERVVREVDCPLLAVPSS